MRVPPDRKRKGPPQRQLRQGPNHFNQLKKPTQKGRPRQPSVYVPRLGLLAKQLRDDGLAPIGLRVFGLAVWHRLRVGGRVDPTDERLLRRLSAERRRQLAATSRMYS